MSDQRKAPVSEELERVREYFADRADASMEPGDDRFHGNEEMSLLADVDAIANLLSNPPFWVPISKRSPGEEGRYFVIYRHNGPANIERAFIGDLHHNGQSLEWSSLPRDCTVILWAPVPSWR